MFPHSNEPAVRSFGRILFSLSVKQIIQPVGWPPYTKTPEKSGVFVYGGENRIRTCVGLPLTYFPSKRLKPLSHLSTYLIVIIGHPSNSSCFGCFRPNYMQYQSFYQVSDTMFIYEDVLQERACSKSSRCDA